MWNQPNGIEKWIRQFAHIHSIRFHSIWKIFSLATRTNVVRKMWRHVSQCGDNPPGNYVISQWSHIFELRCQQQRNSKSEREEIRRGRKRAATSSWFVDKLRWASWIAWITHFLSKWTHRCERYVMKYYIVIWPYRHGYIRVVWVLFALLFVDWSYPIWKLHYVQIILHKSVSADCTFLRAHTTVPANAIQTVQKKLW